MRPVVVAGQSQGEVSVADRTGWRARLVDAGRFLPKRMELNERSSLPKPSRHLQRRVVVQVSRTVGALRVRCRACERVIMKAFATISSTAGRWVILGRRSSLTQ